MRSTGILAHSTFYERYSKQQGSWTVVWITATRPGLQNGEHKHVCRKMVEVPECTVTVLGVLSFCNESIGYFGNTTMHCIVQSGRSKSANRTTQSFIMKLVSV